MELKMNDKELFEKMEAMEEEEIFMFFQEMIDSGVVWNLQGCYGRTAESLIDKWLLQKERSNLLFRKQLKNSVLKKSSDNNHLKKLDNLKNMQKIVCLIN
jgi:hypothetical protein